MIKHVNWPLAAAFLLAAGVAHADRQVTITGTPAYNWFYGCFGTASGNLIGYWDRNGLPNLYTGSVNGGVAPTNTLGANEQIYTMWASRAGYGGRAATNWGHVDDYYAAYESTSNPYKVAGRVPHAHDCIGDFIGLSQYDWTNLNGECNGNINAYSFNYYDTNAARRYNFDAPTPDIQSGLKDYLNYCGYDAEVFSQVSDFYPKTPPGRGFSFFDYMQYIDAGYPVLMHLQTDVYARPGGNNPPIHGILGYGYRQDSKSIYCRNSWGNTPDQVVSWSGVSAIGLPGFYTRGLFILIPKPQITSITMGSNGFTVAWQGGHSVLSNMLSTSLSETTHWYVVEGGTVGQPETMVPLAPATTARSVVITNDPASIGVLAVRNLFRVRFQDTNLDSAVIGQITNKFGPTNMLFDIDLEQVHSVTSVSNRHWNLRGLEFTINATNYDLRGNFITNLEILVRTAERGGMRTGTVVDVRYNPLNSLAQTNQIPAITNAGASVLY